MPIVTPALLEELRRALPQLQLRENEPMRAHCSFRIGGPAAAMALPASQQELSALTALLHTHGVRPFLLGNGTNLLIEDAPLDLFVIKPAGELAACRVEGTRVTGGCAVTLTALACAARDAALTGLEFAHGIPGTLGGGLFMNAGAYGGELKDVCTAVTCMDETGALHRVPADQAQFSYRHSRFADDGSIIVSGELTLAPGDRDAIEARMRELAQKRRASQPLEKPSAGSTFKRPANGYAAAMIDQAGLRGAAVGAAQVSPKHAGFVVNNGGASFDDVITLMRHVQDTVQARFGVRLEPEVRIIGSKTWNF